MSDCLSILRDNPVDAFLFGKVWVNVDNRNGLIQTVWLDGKRWESNAEDWKVKWAMLAELGYGIDIWELRRMNVEHEALHTIACILFGMDSSPTLRYYALHGVADKPDKFPNKLQRDTEEALILDLQRFVNGKGASESVKDLIRISRSKIGTFPAYLRSRLVEAKRAADKWIATNHISPCQ